jgi:hypothetical protein
MADQLSEEDDLARDLEEQQQAELMNSETLNADQDDWDEYLSEFDSDQLADEIIRRFRNLGKGDNRSD